MIHRFDKMLIELPRAKGPNPAAAGAVQELLGGKFGEMSTLMNYTFQSFNFRGREQFRPFYDLVANIAAEEYGHIELVAYTINGLLDGTSKHTGDPTQTPLEPPMTTPGRIPYHYLYSGQGAMPVDSNGKFWDGSNVFSSGNLKLDLLHNFFLECGARAGKIRAYESTDDALARAMIGYLLVRGGVHIVAYALALEKLTGVSVGKLLPIPDISNKKFPEAKKWEDQGVHRKLYRFSPTDYKQAVWNGNHPEDGQPLEYIDWPGPGGKPLDLPAEPAVGAPVADKDGIDQAMLADMLKYVSKLK